MPAQHPRFLAESTLGRLARWLRLAGFDTLYDTHLPDPIRLARICRIEKRTLLTRTRWVKNHAKVGNAVYIRLNNPVDQVRQVIGELGLGSEGMRPLTRCAFCNCRVQPVDKNQLSTRVPDHVMQTHTAFKHCHQCDRIYWQGSQALRWSAFVEQWFTS